MARNIVKGGGISVAASQTNFVVSNPFAPKDRLNVVVNILLSAVVETNDISFQLQDTFDGANWYNVGSESSVSVLSKVLASATDITHGTETFTSTTHGFVTGDAVLFKAGTAAPTGLTDGTTYYIVRVDADNFRLATSRANAYAGSLQAITGNGTGNQTFTKLDYQIRMINEDSNDRAQMPLEDMVRVVCTTGASDTLTVSGIYISEIA